MKQRQKGSTQAILAGIVAMCIVVAVAVVFWLNHINKAKESSDTTAASQSQQSTNDSSRPSLKTYKETALSTGLTVDYPSSWALQESKLATSDEEAPAYSARLMSSDMAVTVELSTYKLPQLGGACEGESIQKIDVSPIAKFDGVQYVAASKTRSDGTLSFAAGVFPVKKLPDPVVGGDGCQLASSNFYFQPGADATIRAVGTITLSALSSDRWNLQSGVTQAQIDQVVGAESFAQAKAIIQSLRIE